MSTLGIVMAPETAPQHPCPTVTTAACGRKIPPAYLACFENRIVEEVQTTGLSSIWSIINELAREDGPRNRAEERASRLEYARALKSLLRRGEIRRVRRTFICLPGQENALSEAQVPRRRGAPSSVNSQAETSEGTRQYESVCPEGVSTDSAQAAENQRQRQPVPDLPDGTDTRRCESVDADPTELCNQTALEPQMTASASGPEPDRQQISQAARALRALPRKGTKRWTGWLHGQHFWRGRPVQLPDGQVVGVLWTCRGKILLQDEGDLDFLSWALWAARKQGDVKVFKHAAAVALGKLKRGVTENPSIRKAEAARRNGKRPCRPGRRRGRTASAPTWTATGG